MMPWPTHEAARRFADRPALINADAAVTHAELAERVEAAARRLAAYGVKPGDLVAWWEANGVDWVVTAHAVWRCGATLLPLSTRWTDAEVGAAIARLRPRLVLGSAAFARRALSLGVPALDPADLVDGPSRADLPAAPAADGPMAVLLTSGTSGAPKAAMLTWQAMAASAEAVAQAIGLGATDRWWLGMPFYHVGGLSALLRCARSGAAAVIAARFEPAATFEELARHRVTIASFVPTMLQGLLEVKGERPWPDALRLAMLGGAAAPAPLARAVPFDLATYGLTEACSTVTIVRPEDTAEGHLSAGTPVPGVRVAIVGPDGAWLGPGEVGEIAVSGPTLFNGYVGDAEATARALRDGWLHTGDHGTLDAHGRLWVLGRRTDLIVSGGENVYPAEVESALAGHPAVAAAAVVAAPSRRWGQSPVAFVVARRAVSEAELGAWLDECLARFKHPRGYVFVSELPLLGNGKVDRRALASDLSKRGNVVA